MVTDSVTLFSDGLLSKWGFSDGDVLDEPLWDHADELGINPRGGDIHAVLIRAVHEYLLPALDQDVQVYEIGTIHNPIRARTVDGVEVDTYTATPTIALTPDHVDVPMDVLWAWFVETLPSADS